MLSYATKTNIKFVINDIELLYDAFYRHSNIVYHLRIALKRLNSILDNNRFSSIGFQSAIDHVQDVLEILQYDFEDHIMFQFSCDLYSRLKQIQYLND